jgi:MFS family permease
VAGPLLATAFLWWRPGDYRVLFALTLVPGLVVLWLLARIPRDAPAAGFRATPGGTEAVSWRAVPSRVYGVLGVLVLFTLGNSTDAYLLLRLSEAGVPVVVVPVVWSALHVVKATASVAGGVLGDRLGRRGVLAAGWLVYAAVYGSFALVTSAAWLVTVFLVYGVYFGLNEGTEKALLADVAPPHLRATVFGLHGAATGLGALLASVTCGALWEWAGPVAAFGLGSALALLAAVLIWPAAGARPATA